MSTRYKFQLTDHSGKQLPPPKFDPLVYIYPEVIGSNNSNNLQFFWVSGSLGDLEKYLETWVNDWTWMADHLDEVTDPSTKENKQDQLWYELQLIHQLALHIQMLNAIQITQITWNTLLQKEL